MPFLLTGGAGFIGPHLTEKLLSEGHQVTVIDNLSTGSSVIELCQKLKIPRLVYTSSTAVYGKQNHLPVAES